MNFLDLANERYSCRSFSDRPVEKELLDKVIDAAIAAPTAVNMQPFRIWVMESEEAKAKLRESTRFSFNAETFLVVGYQDQAGWTRKYDGRPFADIDASIVATHMMLAITDLGLATTWVGHFNAPKLKQLCPQMQDYELIAIFPIGYPSAEEAGKPSPRHFERKSKDQLVETL